MTTITAEQIAAIEALLPRWTIALVATEVPAGKHAGGTFWQAVATLRADARVTKGGNQCADQRDSVMTLLHALTGLPSRLGGNPTERAAAAQAKLLIPE